MKKKLKQTLELVVKHSKKNSFYQKKISWKVHLPHIYSLSKNAKSIEDLIPSFDYIFNLIEDHHAHIRHFKSTKVLTGYRAKDKRAKTPLYYEHKRYVVSQEFKAKQLSEDTGYLRIPAVHPFDKQKEAKKIRKALIKLSEQGVENWVIDLRYNTGGHFESMIAGLSPLFKNGVIAKVVTHKNKCIGKARIKKRKASYFNISTLKLPKHKKVKTNKIGVLTSKYTVSSGELVAVCFKGKKNTKFIGEPTSGKTTNTSVQYIKKLILLILSTGIFADRNDRVYSKNIPVDKHIEFDPLVDFNLDKAVLEAMQWFST